MTSIERIALIILTILALRGCMGCEANADIEVIGGALTYHIFDAGTSPYYTNKVTRDGRLINNTLIGLGFSHQHGILFETCAVFGGQNSIGTPILGALYEKGLEIKGLQLGLAIGGYDQESRPYTDKGIQSYRLFNYKGVDLVPIAGFVVNYKLVLIDKVYLKLNNLISPVLTNTSLSLGYSY